MFSNRSVSVQPFAPPIEYAGVPDPRIVFAIVRNCGHVLAGFAPASLNERTLYQTVDLLAPFKKRPYRFPFTEASWSQTGALFRAIVPRANVIGFSAPRLAKSRIKP